MTRQTFEMSLDDHLVFMLNSARQEQLVSIKSKYRRIIAEILQNDISDLVEMELRDYYIIGATTVGKYYGPDDIAEIEQVRQFKLTALKIPGMPYSEIGLKTQEPFPTFIGL